jgi:Fur family transcriptional regulator, ferric uptake regulator
MQEVASLLVKKNLAKTPCRIDILRVLINSDSALSEQEIRQKMTSGYDRTTVYRTIRNFLSLGIIHGVALEGHDVRYAITRSSACKQENVHVHFHCNCCEGLYCLHAGQFQRPEVPERFIAENYDLVINGVCRKCNTRDNQTRH